MEGHISILKCTGLMHPLSCLSPCQGFLTPARQTQMTRPLGWVHTGLLAFYRTLHSLVTSVMLKQVMSGLCTEDRGSGTTINMLRIKSDTVVIIRSEAGKCNYFFTEQRQMESSWLCNRGKGPPGLHVQSTSLHAFNTHALALRIFSFMPFFLLVFKKQC